MNLLLLMMDSALNSKARLVEVRLSGGARRRGGLLTKLLLFLGALMLLGVVVVLTVAGTLYWRWTSEPTYWQMRTTFIQSTTVEQRRAMSQGLQGRFTYELTELRDEGAQLVPPPARSRRISVTGEPLPSLTAQEYAQVRRISVEFDEVNAWLSEMLDDWLAHEGHALPEQLGDFMVASEGDRLVAAARYESPKLNQVFSVVFDLDLFEDGQARLNIHEVRGGRMSIPLVRLAGYLQELTESHEIREAQEAIAMLRELTFEPVFPIDSTRVAQLMDYQVHEDRVELDLRVGPQH